MVLYLHITHGVVHFTNLNSVLNFFHEGWVGNISCVPEDHHRKWWRLRRVCHRRRFKEDKNEHLQLHHHRELLPWTKLSLFGLPSTTSWLFTLHHHYHHHRLRYLRRRLQRRPQLRQQHHQHHHKGARVLFLHNLQQLRQWGLRFCSYGFFCSVPEEQQQQQQQRWCLCISKPEVTARKPKSAFLFLSSCSAPPRRRLWWLSRRRQLAGAGGSEGGRRRRQHGVGTFRAWLHVELLKSSIDPLEKALTIMIRIWLLLSHQLEVCVSIIRLGLYHLCRLLWLINANLLG